MYSCRILVPDHWCSISYYELDTQIGETFRVRKDRTEVYYVSKHQNLGKIFQIICGIFDKNSENRKFLAKKNCT